MFKSTLALQSTLRRLPLSPKQANNQYYKGNRVGSMGTIDKWGNFKPDFDKIRTFVYPENPNTDLTPFVGADVEKNARSHDADRWELPAKTMTGEQYLKLWKERGGHDVVTVDEAQVYEDKK